MECEHQQGLHIFEDHFIPEIVDPVTLQPVPYGQVGELVFSAVTKEGMPLLRYRTRDLTTMIEIPSFSREENAVADYLERWIESCGYAVNRTGNNVWMLSPGYIPDKPTILLNSHIDTVKPNAGWQRDPFKATIEEEQLYGLGSNDAGASVVSLLHGLREQNPSNGSLRSCDGYRPSSSSNPS